MKHVKKTILIFSLLSNILFAQKPIEKDVNIYRNQTETYLWTIKGDYRSNTIYLTAKYTTSVSDTDRKIDHLCDSIGYDGSTGHSKLYFSLLPWETSSIDQSKLHYDIMVENSSTEHTILIWGNLNIKQGVRLPSDIAPNEPTPVIAYNLNDTNDLSFVKNKINTASSYLMSSFRTSDQSLYLYGSTNGIDWHSLKNGSIYSPSDNPLVSVVRDPSIVFHNNQYWIAHTSNSFSTDSGFAIIKSNDLQNWEDVTFVDVSSVCTDSSRVYAPEFFKDTNGDISVFVAINPDSSKYAGVDWKFKLYELHPLNSAMTTWSEPIEVTGNFPESAIDAFMTKIGDTYYLWYSDLTTHLHIEYATSKSKTSGFVVQENGNWAGWGYSNSWGLTEGESLVQVNDTTWRIYFDYFWDNNHRVYYSESIDTFKTWTTKTMSNFPFADVQHPTVLKTNEPKIVNDINLMVASQTDKDFDLDTLRDPQGNLAVRYFVSEEGNDLNDGKTWRTAKATIQAAIDAIPYYLNYETYILLNKGELGNYTIEKTGNKAVRLLKVMSDVTEPFYTNKNNGDASYIISDDSVTITGYCKYKVIGGYVDEYAVASDGIAFGKIIHNFSDWVGNEIVDWTICDFKGIKFNQTAGSYAIVLFGAAEMHTYGCYFTTYSTSKAIIRTAEKWIGFATFLDQDFDADYPSPYNNSLQINNFRYLMLSDHWSGGFPSSQYGRMFIDLDKIGVSGYYSKVGLHSYGMNIMKIYGDISKLEIFGTESVILQNGVNTIIKNLPTSAPTTSGALWRDASNGNVIKMVP